ncbi:MAG: STAS domain-containing protein [Terracidiphilus sp.]
MGVALTEAEGASLISLEGAIDIARAVELRTVLVAALKEGRQLRVCLDEAAELDVTAFQLLWAAGREAAQKSIDFALAGPLPEPVRNALADMGFDESAFPESFLQLAGREEQAES